MQQTRTHNGLAAVGYIWTISVDDGAIHTVGNSVANFCETKEKLEMLYFQESFNDFGLKFICIKILKALVRLYMKSVAKFSD